MKKILLFGLIWLPISLHAQFNDFCQGPLPYNSQSMNAYKGYASCKIFELKDGKKNLTKEISFNSNGLPIQTNIYELDDKGVSVITQKEEYTYSPNGFCTSYKFIFNNGILGVDEKYEYNNIGQLIKQTDHYDMEKSFVYKADQSLDSIYIIDYNRDEDENGKPVGDRYAGSIFVTTFQLKGTDTLAITTNNIVNEGHGYQKYPFGYEEYVFNQNKKVAEYYTSKAMTTFSMLYKYTYDKDRIITCTGISTMDEETLTAEYIYEYTR